MNFSDIIKKSFLDNFSSDITTWGIVKAFAFAFIIGIYIFIIYRNTTKHNFYSKSFNISLVAMSIITAAVIITIQSSVVVSLGMVGALSIVRFRTAVKNPLDLVYMFWAISTGIICGAGIYKLAILLALAVTVVIIGLDLIPKRAEDLLLIVNSSKPEGENEILDIAKKYAKGISVRSRNITSQGLNIIIELDVKDGTSLVRDINSLSDIEKVSLIKHDGEVTF